jgi:hypothetical protein
VQAPRLSAEPQHTHARHFSRPVTHPATATASPPARLPGPLPPPQAPLKTLAVRKWLAVNVHGEVRHLELAKLRVTAGLGVQLRDLRWVLPPPAGSSSSCCPELVRLGCAALLAVLHVQPSQSWLGGGQRFPWPACPLTWHLCL